MTGGCGLFGKTPSRRDFIALNVSRGFLALWEPWMQRGLARSRADLGADWTDLFLTTPIWSFRLGCGLCGVEVLGATMPSMDGAGRCFPLTLVACGPEGRGLALPEDAARDPWFAAAERFLLSTLDPAAAYPELLAALDRLPRPADGPGEGEPMSTLWWTDGGAAGEPDRFEDHGMPPPAAMTRMIGRRATLEAVVGNGGSA